MKLLTLAPLAMGKVPAGWRAHPWLGQPRLGEGLIWIHLVLPCELPPLAFYLSSALLLPPSSNRLGPWWFARAPACPPVVWCVAPGLWPAPGSAHLACRPQVPRAMALPVCPLRALPAMAPQGCLPLERLVMAPPVRGPMSMGA